MNTPDQNNSLHPEDPNPVPQWLEGNRRRDAARLARIIAASKKLNNQEKPDQYEARFNQTRSDTLQFIDQVGLAAENQPITGARLYFDLRDPALAGLRTQVNEVLLRLSEESEITPKIRNNELAFRYGARQVLVRALAEKDLIPGGDGANTEDNIRAILDAEFPAAYGIQYSVLED